MASSKPKPAPKPAAPSRKRGAIPMPETDVMGRGLVADSSHLTLTLDQLEPDPNQARWVLPAEVRAKFVAGELTATQALERWRKLAEKAARSGGKGAALDEDHPELKKLREIESLAKSIKAGGQVNPITVARHGAKWRIETGERRFWAHVYLVHVLDDSDAERVPANVTAKLDVFRQAVENLHAAPLNAVALGREVARLLMAGQGKNPAPGQDLEVLSLSAYRAVASSRVPPKGWDRIGEAMGKTPDHLSRHLRLLLLPDEAIVLADRADLTEKQLRPVTELKDAQTQARVVKLAVELKLSSADVEWLCNQPDLDKAEQELRARLLGKPEEKAPRAKFSLEESLYKRLTGFRRFIQSVERGGGQPAAALARFYKADKGETARTELQQMIELLSATVDELARLEQPDPAADGPASEDRPEGN